MYSQCSGASRQVLLFLGLIWPSPARPARADMELDGRWLVRAGFDECQLELRLTGAELAASGSCSVAGAIEGAGTFDAASGHFKISGSAEAFCHTFTADATVAPDGMSFAGTVDCEDFGNVQLRGSHCPKGLLCATDDALREAIERALADYQRLGLRGLLGPGAVVFGLEAPSSGVLDVELYRAPGGGFRSFELLAVGHAEVERPGHVVVQLRFTRRGRRLLRRRKQLVVALKATFAGPAGTVTQSRGSVAVVR